MKKILTIIFSLISFNVFSQISLPYYYVIPPSGAGCNGEIAIDSRPTVGIGCNTPISYSCDCSMQCMLDLEFVQDTIFIHNVCNIPCAFYATSSDGGACFICGVGSTSGIAENVNTTSVVFNQHMSALELKNIAAGNYVLSVTDLTGKLISKINFNVKTDQATVPLSDLPLGVYLYSLEGRNFYHSGRIAKY